VTRRALLLAWRAIDVVAWALVIAYEGALRARCGGRTRGRR